MDFLPNIEGNANPYIVIAIVIYCIFGGILLFRHKGESDVELMSHALTLLGFIFTLFTLLSLLYVLVFKLEEAEKIFPSAISALGFSVVASIAWAHKTWVKLWAKSTSRIDNKGKAQDEHIPTA